MNDTSYMIFFIVGLFSIVLGTLAVLLPKKLTIWEEKLFRKLRLISKSRPVTRVKAESFIQERLLGLVLLIFGIIAIYYLPVELTIRIGSEGYFTLLSDKDAKAADFEQETPVSSDLIPAQGLYMISARYGISNRWRDVLKQLREKISNNAISIKTSNDIAGDPASGKVKTLRVEYVLDGERKTVKVQEGQWLHIPSDVEQHPEVHAVTTREQLLALVKQCPAEVGFFGKNLSTGDIVEYRPDQPACLASIVKIFVLLEVMQQVDQGTLTLSEIITIERKDEKESCTISEALDKMIGISDNEATDTLAARVGYKNVNALPAQLGIAGLSEEILPEPGVFGKALDKRVFGKTKLCPIDSPLLQHGSARGIVRYFELLHSGSLVSESVSKAVLDVFDRNPKNFIHNATPTGFKSVGKGGSCAWIRPDRPQYNMTGWGLLIRNGQTALALCVWCEWFPEQNSEGLKRKWCSSISGSIVNILFTQESSTTETPSAQQITVSAETK
ncbi:MAG: serine hydrolase [Planctomycetota bacterium]|jgi:beta-lactamase class A